jgi:hypothetical protein
MNESFAQSFQYQSQQSPLSIVVERGGAHELQKSAPDVSRFATEAAMTVVNI